MTTVLLKAHAKHKNVFQDPEDDQVWYISHIKSHTGVLSHFLIPEQSRYFQIPPSIIESLEDHSSNILDEDQLTYYPKYRSIWMQCPSCDGQGTCASIYLKDTDIFVGHCTENGQYNFGVATLKEYISANCIEFLEDNKLTDEDYITLHNIEMGK